MTSSPGHPRVLQVHNAYRQPGGEDAVVAAENALLREAGYPVALHHVINRPSLAAAVDLAMAVWNPRAARTLEEALESFRPDVVHVHNTWYALSPAAVAAAHERAPVAMTLHNYRLTCANAVLFRAGSPCRRCVRGTPWQGLWLGCYRDPFSSAMAAATVAIHRRAATWKRHVEVFFVLSEFAREVMAEAGLPLDRLVVKANFVEDPGVRLQAADQADFVLYAGRLAEEKGISRLLERWARFATGDLRLVVCGDGPLRPLVEQAPRVEYRGRVGRAELKDLMLRARALVFPSVWFEGQPMTILEAFAAGLPVLASRIGAVSELVDFLGDRWLADPDDDEEWGAALGVLAGGDVEGASHAVRARYLDRYTPRAALAGLATGYRLAIDSR